MNSKKNFLKSKTNFFLFLLISFLLTCNLIWFNSGHKPLHWDSSIHLGLSIDAYNVFESQTSMEIVNKLLGVSWYYPPMVYFVSVPFYYLFGINEFTGFFEITVFLLVLVCAVYFIGKKIYGVNAGLLASFCIAMYPVVIEYSRDYMLDLPLASMTAIFVYMLLKSDNFSKSIFCVLSGIFLGCGMLVKWTFLFFVVTPLIYSFVCGLKSSGNKLYVWFNFFLTIFLGLILCLPWYLKNLIMIFTTRSGELGRSDLNTVQSIFYYLKIIPEQVSVVIAVLFIAAVILFSYKRKLNLNKFLLLWLTGSYLMLTLIKIKAPRFSISLLIPLTILISGLIFSVPDKQLRRKIFLAVFVPVVLIQYLIISFANPNVNFTVPFAEAPLLNNLSPVQFENYNLKLLDIINAERIKEKKETALIRMIPDEPNFNNSTMKYYARLKNYPVNVLGINGFPLFTNYAVVQKINSQFTSKDSKRMELTAGLLSDTSGLSKIFHKFEIINIPDGNAIIIFKPDNKRDTSISGDSLKAKIVYSSENFLKRYLKPESNFNSEIEFADHESALSGNVKLLRLISGNTEFGDFAFKKDGLKLTNFEIEIKEFSYIMKSLLDENKLDIISINGLKVNSLEISADDLKEYIEKSSSGKVKIKNISFEDNLISIEGYSEQLNTEFYIDLILLQNAESNLTFEIKKCKIFNIAFPSTLLNYMLSNYNPLIKGIEFIKEFKLNKLEVSNNKITIK